MKDRTYWCCKRPDGTWATWTLSYLRAVSINEAEEPAQGDEPEHKWPELYRKGWRCVRVRLLAAERGEG
jgi:hypothetical protein